ncbi:MAG TPA: hypothetical protein VGR32_01340 [Brevundimonas sp.]|jgi:hypothetical protein|uniref:hypothetical protein n=1 Tax=Brevundimonas sp. TaxID=1871086 RepID=UPI002DE8773F|nr:hypothetical protein [Brevundimonas sp.]
MSAHRLILSGLAALALAACASTAPVVAPGADAVAPQPIDGHDWFLGDAGDHLSYGLNESDDVWLSMSCEAGTGSIEINQYLELGSDAAIALESGGDTETWRAAAQPSELGDGQYLAARAGADEPVFQRFRRLGWLAAYGPDRRVPMVAHPGSAPRIERFFVTCG